MSGWPKDSYTKGFEAGWKRMEYYRKQDEKRITELEAERDRLRSQMVQAGDIWKDVKPLGYAAALAGTWPGEADDGFEALIDDARHGGYAEQKRIAELEAGRECQD